MAGFRVGPGTPRALRLGSLQTRGKDGRLAQTDRGLHKQVPAEAATRSQQVTRGARGGGVLGMGSGGLSEGGAWKLGP